MTKIIWTEPALLDLDGIHAYIARDSEVYANGLILEILHSVDQLEQFPKSGRIVPEFNEENTRELVIGNYRVVYDIVKSQIQILTVLHGARLFRKAK